MKPHEQSWMRDEHHAGRINATDAITLEVKVAFWRVPGGDSEALKQAQAVQSLALAAPDMARALLAVFSDDTVRMPGHVEAVIRAALAKAEVL